MNKISFKAALLCKFKALDDLQYPRDEVLITETVMNLIREYAGSQSRAAFSVQEIHGSCFVRPENDEARTLFYGESNVSKKVTSKKR